MEIRQVQSTDAESVLALMNTLDAETRFMLFEPGERQTTLDQQRDILQSFESASDKVMFVGVSDKKVVGFITGIGNKTKRNKHALYCVMGVLQAETGKGLGKRLLTHLEQWSRDNGITRMTLTVMCHNERAKRLYLSQGFEIEGTKKRSLYIDGQYIDEYCMAKLL